MLILNTENHNKYDQDAPLSDSAHHLYIKKQLFKYRRSFRAPRRVCVGFTGPVPCKWQEKAMQVSHDA